MYEIFSFYRTSSTKKRNAQFGFNNNYKGGNEGYTIRYDNVNSLTQQLEAPVGLCLYQQVDVLPGFPI